MSSLIAEKAKLLERIEILEEENRQFKELFEPEGYQLPRDWRLTKTETKVLIFIASRKQVTWEQMQAHCEYLSEKHEPLGPQITRTWICKINSKVRPDGWKIANIWGVGCYLENREKFNKLYRRQDHADR